MILKLLYLRFRQRKCYLDKKGTAYTNYEFDKCCGCSWDICENCKYK